MDRHSAPDELVFLPLGGSGEIGMNLNAYGFGPPEARKWIIVDVGVTFGGVDTPGVDVIVPDPTFLEERREDILGIVLTHAHEDHIGAIGWLWPKFKAPIYATPFTAWLVREKLKERGLQKTATVHELPLKGKLALGPFQIEFITLTHSIPEPNGLVIRTPLGVVWHTGDWKIDPDPIIGEITDEASLRALGEGGVLAMICDSTNVFVEGEAGSEAGVRERLADVIAARTGRVAVTAFASNVARVDSVIRAAQACGRSVCLVGRSMHKITAAAKSVGLLADVAAFVPEEEAGFLPPEAILYLCTGSQGEARAALARIAAGDHRHVTLGDGDTVIFSSRVIPGNEVGIYALYNRFAERGVEIVTDRDAHVHVSGHPCRDELRQMYQWARPRIAVPVHGERRHLLEHAKLARELQTPEAIAPRNGDLIRLAPGPARVVDEVPAGRLHVDGERLVEAEGEALRERRRIAEQGALMIILAVDEHRRKIVSGPEVRTRGLPADDEDHYESSLDDIARAAEIAFHKLSPEERRDEDLAEAAIVRAVKRVAEKVWGKRPLIEAVVLPV